MLGLILLGMVIYGVSLVINELSEETGLMIFMCTIVYMSYQFTNNKIIFVFLNIIGLVCMFNIASSYVFKFRFRTKKFIEVIFDILIEMIVGLLIIVVIFAIALHGSGNVEIAKIGASGIIILSVLVSFVQKYISCIRKHSNKKQGGEY